MNTLSMQANTLRLPASFAALYLRHTLWWQAALAFTALMVLCGVFGSLDGRTFNGVSVWVKPFKFSLSIAVYFASLAWFAPLLPNGFIESRKGRWMTLLPIVCAVFEIVYIVLQASRGEASHFNLTSPLRAAMYSLMGFGAIVMVAVCLWMGVLVLRTRRDDPYAFSVGVGLVLTFILGGGFGGYMGQHMSHWVGGTQSDAAGLWLMKWSRDGGDLRVAHFFGMHAMQVLPIFAALLPRAWPARLAIGVVVGAAAVYAAITTFTFVQAIHGLPFV
jgi:hypothetical protein